MTELLYKFSFQHPRYTPGILWCAAALWLLVLMATWTSIHSRGFAPRQKLFWYLLVTFIPLLGVLSYLPFSVARDEMPQMFLFRHAKTRRARGTSHRA